MFNLTTIEYKEKNKGDENRGRTHKNYFNLGTCSNLSEILGKNTLFWLVPTNVENHGYSFEIDKQMYSDIMKDRIMNCVNSASKKESSKNRQMVVSDHNETNVKMESVNLLNLSPSPTPFEK